MKYFNIIFFVSDWIWHTDLDFIITHRDRTVVLSFMTPNTTAATLTNNHPTIRTTAAAAVTAVTAVAAATVGAKPSAMPFIDNPEVTHQVIKTLKDFIGHENHTVWDNKNIGESEKIIS